MHKPVIISALLLKLILLEDQLYLLFSAVNYVNGVLNILICLSSD
jgi:hypothetical protein